MNISDLYTKINWRLIHWIVVAAAIAIAITLILHIIKKSPSKQYVTVTATRGDIENTVMATGTLQAVRQVDVGTRVTGQLKALKVKIGDRVRAGDLLAEIDPIQQENELRSAEANLAILEAQRRSIVAKQRRALLELDRQKGMIKSETTSRKELQGAEVDVLSQEADLNALDAKLIQARSLIDIARANLLHENNSSDRRHGGFSDDAARTNCSCSPNCSRDSEIGATGINDSQDPDSRVDVIYVEIGQDAFFVIMGDSEKKHVGKVRSVELVPQVNSDSNSTKTVRSRADQRRVQR